MSKITIDRATLEMALQALKLIDAPLNSDMLDIWEQKTDLSIAALSEALEQPQPTMQQLAAGAFYPQVTGFGKVQPEFASPGGGHVPAIPIPPASKPWVGLTDEELRDSLQECPKDAVDALRVRWLYAKDFARAIEAKLKEKNT